MTGACPGGSVLEDSTRPDRNWLIRIDVRRSERTSRKSVKSPRVRSRRRTKQSLPKVGYLCGRPVAHLVHLLCGGGLRSDRDRTKREKFAVALEISGDLLRVEYS